MVACNIDLKTVEGFGDEWAAYDQDDLPPAEHRRLFHEYFSTFPFERLPDGAKGFDLGCGTGRWALLLAEHVGRLHCIEPAAEARLEHGFSRAELQKMTERCGLAEVTFRNLMPYWVTCGIKAREK